MKENKVYGDFECAVQILISSLIAAQSNPALGRFASDLLLTWDQQRGTDWLTSTLRREELK